MGLNRSQQMAQIRRARTAPEMRDRSARRSVGLRHCLDARGPVGRPDLVFPRPRVVVFIDGCFWRGCPQHYTRRGSREDFWAGKLMANTTRDRDQTLALDAAGWRPVRVWEHEVFTAIRDVVGQIREPIKESSWTPPIRPVVVRVDVLDPVVRPERHHVEVLRGSDLAQTVDRVRNTTRWRRRRPA